MISQRANGGTRDEVRENRGVLHQAKQVFDETVIGGVELVIVESGRETDPGRLDPRVERNRSSVTCHGLVRPPEILAGDAEPVNPAEFLFETLSLAAPAPQTEAVLRSPPFISHKLSNRLVHALNGNETRVARISPMPLVIRRRSSMQAGWNFLS